MGLNDNGDDDDGFIDWQDAGDLDDAGLLHDSHPHQVQQHSTSIFMSIHVSAIGEPAGRPKDQARQARSTALVFQA